MNGFLSLLRQPDQLKESSGFKPAEFRLIDPVDPYSV